MLACCCCLPGSVSSRRPASPTLHSPPDTPPCVVSASQDSSCCICLEAIGSEGPHKCVTTWALISQCTPAVLAPLQCPSPPPMCFLVLGSQMLTGLVWRFVQGGSAPVWAHLRYVGAGGIFLGGEVAGSPLPHMRVCGR